MIWDESREKRLQNIVRGELQEGEVDSCTAARNLLCRSFGTGPTVKSEFESRAILKEKQVAFLKRHARTENLWIESLPPGSQFIAEGGESRVYLSGDGLSVIKLNDAGYYATWTEYFNSLALHNLIFSNTAYSLVGFAEFDGKFFAVIQQPFIAGGQATLEDIEEFLNYNGFRKMKRQDYHEELYHIVLEDMHDENVIAKEGVLFFIDTVFYIVETK